MNVSNVTPTEAELNWPLITPERTISGPCFSAAIPVEIHQSKKTISGPCSSATISVQIVWSRFLTEKDNVINQLGYQFCDRLWRTPGISLFVGKIERDGAYGNEREQNQALISKGGNMLWLPR